MKLKVSIYETEKGNTYYIDIDKFGDYDITKLENSSSKKIATSIVFAHVEDVIDAYERGTWCDLCRSDGTIEDAEGDTHLCTSCNN